MRAAILVLLVCPLAAPAFPVPKSAKAPDISGTIWKGANAWSEGQRETLTLKFCADGVLQYDSENAIFKYTARWRQDGETITWTVNDHASFKAVYDNRKLQGTGSNKDGNTATVSFTRVESK